MNSERFIWNASSQNPNKEPIADWDVDPYKIKDQMIDAYGKSVLLDIAQVLAREKLTPDTGQIFCRPHTHNFGRPKENQSAAVYIADYEIPGDTNEHGEQEVDRVLVSFFSPSENTEKSSRHKHTTPEKYKKFGEKGKVGLLINDTVYEVLDGEYIVRPGDWHQVIIEKGPAILIIHMKAAGGKADSEMHQFNEV